MVAGCGDFAPKWAVTVTGVPEPHARLPVYPALQLSVKPMPTTLDKSLKRALEVNGKPFVLTISPMGFTLIPRGRRKGHEILWSDFVSGEAALASALNASLQFSAESEKPVKAAARKPAAKKPKKP